MALEHDALSGFRDVALPDAPVSFPESTWPFVVALAVLCLSLLLYWRLRSPQPRTAVTLASDPEPSLSFPLLVQLSTAGTKPYLDLLSDLAALVRQEVSKVLGHNFQALAAEEVPAMGQSGQQRSALEEVGKFLGNLDRLRFSGALPSHSEQFTALVAEAETLVSRVSDSAAPIHFAEPTSPQSAAQKLNAAENDSGMANREHSETPQNQVQSDAP